MVISTLSHPIIIDYVVLVMLVNERISKRKTRRALETIGKNIFLKPIPISNSQAFWRMNKTSCVLV